MNVSLITLWAIVGWLMSIPNAGESPGVYFPNTAMPGVYLQSISRSLFPYGFSWILGGILGGWLFSRLFGIPLDGSITAVDAAASALGAYLGARLIAHIWLIIMQMLGRGKG